ncbi:MAG: DUF1836 domain-containing protein [Ruminococcaceae bacterium]|nr:DUF1836 domain-containing protein [Oscillospiraceae bacterium]
MILKFHDDYIPGTKLKKSEMDNLTGMEFLKKVFFISEGVMLTQIRDISGIDSSTLQNWTKRGWVVNSKLKKYNVDQVAHILIINMLRSCMQLDKIAFLIQYINGKVGDASDDIISDSMLYDYICRILENMMHASCSLSSVHAAVETVTADYAEPVAGARERLNKALEVIVVTYYAALIKQHATGLLEKLENPM